ncbi:MAG: 4a-hydroxytetrahydrobiopterin dehydratase [Opitutales bacterium]|jgi:4a-hydroxytetrahydrobiopterin dehydratase
MSTPLHPSEIELALKELPEWTYEDDRLNREMEFGSFKEAMAFIVRVGFEAESLNHYPEIFCVFDRVALSLTSVDAEMKVTQRDVLLAHKIEALIAAE